MSNTIYFDLETDGLYDEASVIWCIGHQSNEDSEPQVFHGDWEETYSFIRDYLYKADTLVGHNIIGFDLPVINKLFGIYPHSIAVIDTWLLSRMLCPDRHSHSLDAWGKTLGCAKGKHNDWTQLSKEMIEYCKQDIAVTYKVEREMQRRIEKYNG